MSKQSRQLAAIMFTDIVGYTALMQHDEKEALDKLHHFKEELNEKVNSAGGQIIQYYGDGCLVIFSNPTDALQCSKTLQEIFRTHHQIPVRIGIHLGEIVTEDGNIFGDSVNIASRIQSMSVPGGVLFSDTIKNQIKNKPGFQFTSLGRFEFKNVDEPLEVLALSNPGFPVPNKSELQGKFKVATKTKPWYKNKIKLAAAVLFVVTLVVTGYFINKPSSSSDPGKSIAVLAFTDMSPDKSQEYLGDGLADDIITALSSIKDLKVTGRTSSFQFKGKNTDLREIGEKLDVSVILEGSVQKSGNSIRVTAQLIDANDGKHIWSQKWDREMNDIFKIQDEIATGISNKLKVTILKKAEKENQKVNSASYELFLQGRVKFYSGNPLDRFNSKEYFLKSIKIDSSNSNTSAYLSLAYENAMRAFPPTDPAMKKLLHDSAYYYAEQSIRIDPENSMAYIAKATWMAGYYNWIEIDRLYRKAHELNPGATEKEEFSGFLTYMGYEKETLKLIDEALQLEPLSESVKSSQLLALQQFRKFDECITTAKKYLEQDSTNINYWTQLAYAYAGKNQYRLALDAWSHQHESYGNKELAYIYRTSDLKTAFLTWVEHSKSNKVYVPNNLTRAFVFSMLGDKKTSIDYLELAVANNEYGVARIKTSWYFDLLRNETRFKELYRKLNFDAYDEYQKTMK